MSVEELEEIFAKVEVTAVGRDYNRESALMSERLDADGVRWLLENGAEVDAVDQFGNTALTHRSRSAKDLEVARALLAHGADPNATGSRSPLAAAAEWLNVEGVVLLLEAGADPLGTVGKRVRSHTVLDCTMARMRDYQATRALEVVRILVARGATISGETPKYMRKTMTTLQGLIARGKGSEENLASLTAIFEMLGVEPSEPPRTLAPGEPITVTADGWKAQFNELWTILVPPGGSAESVQGEVVRIAGRVANELLGNGGGNWDRDFDRMLVAFGEHVRTGTALDGTALARVDEALDALRGGGYDEPSVDVLAQESVGWVLRNPDRVPLPSPGYGR